MFGIRRGKLVILGFLFLLSLPGRAQDILSELTKHRAVAENPTLDPQSYELSQPRPISAKRPGKAAWIASWVAFVAVNVVDAHSSTGRHEANPLLRDNNGLFNSRKAAVVKSAAGGGFFALQCWLIHKNPNENYYRSFAVATGATATALGAVAVRNYNLYRAPQPQSATVVPDYLRRKP
jgi:hypothetical protein